MIIEALLARMVPYIAGILEGIGVIVVIIASYKAAIKFIKRKFIFHGDDSIRIEFSMGLALALEFKLGAEILKTVVVRTLDEFLILAAVTLLRIIISFVIHWEVKTLEKDQKVEIVEINGENNKDVAEDDVDSADGIKLI